MALEKLRDSCFDVGLDAKKKIPNLASQILYTLLYGEVMYRPPRWTVFETSERFSPR